MQGLGVAGAAASTLATTALGALVLAAYLLRPNGAVALHGAPWQLRPALLRTILRVGAPASLSPVLTNGSIAAATAFIGSFGTAGQRVTVGGGGAGRLVVRALAHDTGQRLLLCGGGRDVGVWPDDRRGHSAGQLDAVRPQATAIFFTPAKRRRSA